MSAKDYCGELPNKVLDVQNVELNVMTNAKTYSTQIAFNVSVFILHKYLEGDNKKCSLAQNLAISKKSTISLQSL